jgi:hypothetical protein
MSDHNHSISHNHLIAPSTYPYPNISINGISSGGGGGGGNSDVHNRLYGRPTVYSDDVPSGKAYWLNGTIHMNPRDRNPFINPPPKEPTMSTIDKIKAERREKREREELEAKFDDWTAALGSSADGDVVYFTVDLNTKMYKYAAVFTNKLWYLTGAILGGLADENFIAFLIDKDVKIGDLCFMEAMEQ